MSQLRRKNEEGRMANIIMNTSRTKKKSKFKKKLGKEIGKIRNLVI